MKELLDSYKRRLQTMSAMIDELQIKDDCNPKYIRYKTKASCYRTIISELERELSK